MTDWKPGDVIPKDDTLGDDYTTRATVSTMSAVLPPQPGLDWHAKVTQLESDHKQTKNVVAATLGRVKKLEQDFGNFEGKFDQALADIKRCVQTVADSQLRLSQAMTGKETGVKQSMLVSMLAGAIAGLFSGLILMVAIKLLP